MLPDYDIECGHYNASTPKSDAWLVAGPHLTVIPEQEVAQTPFTCLPHPTSDVILLSIAHQIIQPYSIPIRSLWQYRKTGSCHESEDIQLICFHQDFYFITLETDDHQFL